MERNHKNHKNHQKHYPPFKSLSPHKGNVTMQNFYHYGVNGDKNKNGVKCEDKNKIGKVPKNHIKNEEPVSPLPNNHLLKKDSKTNRYQSPSKKLLRRNSDNSPNAKKS